MDETVRALLPALWLYEVGNTIARRFPVQASGWVSALMKFGIEKAPSTGAGFAQALKLTS